MQKVMLIGNLGRDPEVKYSQQGTAIAQFSVATTERWKDKEGKLREHTEWFSLKAFGRRAEIIVTFLALLELLRRRLASARQAGPMAPIMIYRAVESLEEQPARAIEEGQAIS